MVAEGLGETGQIRHRRIDVQEAGTKKSKAETLQLCREVAALDPLLLVTVGATSAFFNHLLDCADDQFRLLERHDMTAVFGDDVPCVGQFIHPLLMELQPHGPLNVLISLFLFLRDEAGERPAAPWR